MDEQIKTSYKIPSEWIERIFKRFAEIWGERYIAMFRSEWEIDLERTRWQSGLYGATSEEIRKTLDMCRTGYIKDPPNAVEFFHYCKGHKQPPPKPKTVMTTATKELGQQYIKLIRDKLHGRIDTEGENTLSALNQSVLDKKEGEKPTHWQND